jgi:hypothetical protein
MGHPSWNNFKRSETYEEFGAQSLTHSELSTPLFPPPWKLNAPHTEFRNPCEQLLTELSY